MQKELRTGCLLAAACVLAMPGAAQTITGSVTGTVTDASGAVVRNATVTARNVDTGVETQATSNDAGVYSLRFLPIGRYTVTATAAGFSQQQVGPFALEIGQTAKVDAKLAVGASTATVEVQGELAPLLNTEDHTIATTLTANTIENIPLNGRNFSSLSLFTMGAVSTQPSGLTGSNATERNTGSNGQVSTNGNRLQTNDYLLDGVEINETINNLIGYSPNPDALGEVKIISANAPAEYGNVTGGDTIALLKNGTNNFHGSLSAYLEDYLMDANTWGNKHQTSGVPIARNPYTQTLYSATLGGPIIKNKLFFFADGYLTRYHSGGLATSTVLDARMRTGDFSELLNPAIMCGAATCANQSSLVQLYDSSTVAYTAYANNQVTITSPVATFLFAHPEVYPLPNTTPLSGSPITNNYIGATSTQRHNNQGDIRVDYTPTSADRFFVSYFQGEAGDATINPIAVTFPGSSQYPDKGVAINYVRTISPSVVNAFRAGFTRIRWEQSNPTDTTGVFGTKGNSLVGIPGTQAFQGFSAQVIRGATTVGSTAGGTNFIDNTFLYGDDLTWQRGRHLLKFGVQALRYQQNNFYPGNDGALGQFRYGQDLNGSALTFTTNPNVVAANLSTVPSGAGYGPADFVLNRVAAEGVGGVTGRTGQRQWRTGYYVQDDWKVKDNLTFNLGVRYEYFQPIYEVNDKMANVNPTTGGVMYAGHIPSGAVSNASICPTRACYTTTYNNWMPRIGFSYQPLTKFVLRGGFGITKELEGTGANLRLTYNPPYQPSLELTGVAPSTTSTGTYFSVSNGFSSSAAANYSGTVYRAWSTTLQPQVTNMYNLTTEYQLNNYQTLTVGYVGESSNHLIQAVAANQLRQPCVINGVLSSTPNSTACAAADPAPYQSLVGQSGNVVLTASEGMANYNALQVQFRQRQLKGLEYQLNYTYGHAFTNTCGFFCVPGISGPSAYAENAYNNSGEYGPAGQDVRHAVNGTLVYALPFGRGRAYGSNINAALDELIGGWKASMTGVVYTGFPVTINAASNNAYTNNKAQRPNQSTNTHFSTHSLNNWWGGNSATAVAALAAKYTQPLAGTYGNARVGSERGPGFQQYDLSLFKDFRIYQEHKIGFRADAFNLFNLTSLGNPDNGRGDSNFGQITSVRSSQRQLQLSAKYQF